MSADQRCGTCRWWEKARFGWCLREDVWWGNCSFPLPAVPDSVFDDGWIGLKKGEMPEADGTTCPCWEAKE